MDKTEFILASKSPRRKEILSSLGIKFEITESDFDESEFEYNGTDPAVYVQELAFLKANGAAKHFSSGKNKMIIAADTVVCLENEILKKPKDKQEAKRMLKMLSGNVHEVYTGVCVYKCSDCDAVSKSCVTKVKFKELSDEKIDAYIKTGEPMDKAGAYGIQGFGATLTEYINGDYFNVVGLPVSLLADILENDYNITLF